MTFFGGLTFFDLFALFVIGFLAVRGLLRGFVREVIFLLAWVASGIAVYLFQTPLTQWLQQWITMPMLAASISFILLVVASYANFCFLASGLAQRIQGAALRMSDRVLGLILGAVKGGAFVLLVYVTCGYFFGLVWGGESTKPAWLSKGRLSPTLEKVANIIVGQASPYAKKLGALQPDPAALPDAVHETQEKQADQIERDYELQKEQYEESWEHAPAVN